MVFKIIPFELVAANSSLLFWEYLVSADNGLTYNHKISHLTKRDIFQLFLCQNDKRIDKIPLLQTSTLFGIR